MTICVNAEIIVVMKPRPIKFVLGFLHIIRLLSLYQILGIIQPNSYINNFIFKFFVNDVLKI